MAYRETKQEMKISCDDIWRTKPTRISFMVRAVYELLPTPVNLARWNQIEYDLCLTSLVRLESKSAEHRQDYLRNVILPILISKAERAKGVV